MKKKLALVLTGIVMAAAVMGCNSQSSTPETTTAELATDADEDAAEADTEAPEAADGETYKIGIVQLTEHPALDAAYEGFVDGLEEAGYVNGQNITIDYNNAQGDQSTCVTIASKLVNDRSDLILAIATPAAQAVAGKTEEIPILVTAVTDPANSGLVDSNDAPGGNVSGTSDLTPIAEQIKLLQQLVPDAQNVAILYCSSEDNSEIQAEMARAALDEAGISWQNATVSNTNEIQSVVQSLVNKVDVIYSFTDNMIAEGMAAVASIANENGIPVIVGEEGMCSNGGLATYGIDYYNLGKQTAAQAVKILKGEATPAEMPIEFLEDCELVINTTAMEELGITIPEEILAEARLID